MGDESARSLRRVFALGLRSLLLVADIAAGAVEVFNAMDAQEQLRLMSVDVVMFKRK